MSVEIFIMVKVDKADQVHSVMAALTSLKCYEAGIRPANVTVAATDNVHQPSAHVQRMLDRELGTSSEELSGHTSHNPIETTIEVNSGSSRTAESHSQCPYTPVSRVYESVRQRVFDALRSGKQPHKDDGPCAAALVQKGELLWNGKEFSL